MVSEQHVFDLLPGYALGCLDADDLLLVARHIPGCSVCQKELQSYRAATGQLALGVELQTPPTDLREKVIRRVSSESRRQNDSSPLKSSRPGLLATLRTIFRQPAGFALGAAALVLVVVLAVSNLVIYQRMNALQARVPEGNVRVIHMAGTDNAPKAVGYLMIFPSEIYGTLTVEDAPVLDASHQYQLWLVKDGKRTNGGVFSVNESGYGTLAITVDQPLENFQTFGITIEPTGGSPGPTGKKVLGGTS